MAIREVTPKAGSKIVFELEGQTVSKTLTDYNKQTAYMTFDDGTSYYGPFLAIDWGKSDLVHS